MKVVNDNNTTQYTKTSTLSSAIDMAEGIDMMEGIDMTKGIDMMEGIDMTKGMRESDDESDTTDEDLDEVCADDVLRDLIKTQALLQEREVELIRKDEELERLRFEIENLNNSRHVDKAHVSESQCNPASLQNIIDQLKADLGEKDRQLRSKDWDMAREKAEWQRELQSVKQEGKRQQAELEKQIFDLMQPSFAKENDEKAIEVEVDRITTHDAYCDNALKLLCAEVASLRGVVESLKSNGSSI
ncbi:hypothetical protein K504DRAFT_466488 [Pleomassaria siparia CBS 279.74]|uniref:Uncharacterized protein n=1 Tax=Pleomassaria siparia CBS 279.74 TaxID=1314801 RepID=A0A6G1KBZ1_9PLEO|nr:hypothetical protein K504DRAFT_466488 [Pleomassaria siparia CBS 279.74]